jgi:hypothetical protein
MGGVARTWRDDATWAPVLRGFDLLSPWTVGAYVDEAGADNYQRRLAREGGRMLRGERPLEPNRPIAP